jgi:hypothetical protein
MLNIRILLKAYTARRMLEYGIRHPENMHHAKRFRALIWNMTLEEFSCYKRLMESYEDA